MDMICKNCGCTVFVEVNGKHECIYCGEYIKANEIEKDPIIDTTEVDDIVLFDTVDRDEIPDIFLNDEETIYEDNSLEEQDDNEVVDLEKSDDLEENVEVDAVDELNLLNEDFALECFKDGRFEQGFKVMDALSELGSGPFKNLTYYYIAKCFETGEGVSADVERAKYFYGLAENNDPLGSELELGEVSYLLAMMYVKGGFFAVDEMKAFKLFEIAARFNYDKGIYNCALCYKLGKGVAKDETKAFELFNKCAQCDYPLAYFQIGKAFENGVGVTKDASRAIDAYHKAADKGAVAAMVTLGNMYYYGIDGVADYDKAFQWYDKGATLGDNNCQYNLAQCYYNGIGCSQNIQKAIDLLFETIRQGNQPARKLLKEIRDRHSLSLYVPED